ncbi:hypothetical protein GCM10027578_21570 [Spirosoma luteolum]
MLTGRALLGRLPEKNLFYNRRGALVCYRCPPRAGIAWLEPIRSYVDSNAQEAG